MLVARLICSDPACAAAFEGRARTLGDLETLACECGCGLAVLGWPDDVEEPSGALELVLLA